MIVAMAPSSTRLRVAWFVARAELRRTWRGAVVVALVLGTLWGLSLGTAIGARRNATAYPRMMRETKAIDVVVNPQSLQTLRVEDVVRLPGVVDSDVWDIHAALVNSDDLANGPNVLFGSFRDGHTISRFERLVLRRGRRPAAERADEAIINPEFARQFHLDVGDRVTLSVFALPDMKMVHRPVWIVGVGRFSDEGVKEGGQMIPRFILSHAFNAQNRSSVAASVYVVRLAAGTDVNAFKNAVNALAPGETMNYQTRVGIQRDVNRSNNPQTLALIAFAAILGIAAAVATLQLIAQSNRRREAEQGAGLHALGQTRRDSAVVSILLSAPTILLAAVVALGIALVLSARFPVGVVRRLEVHPGVQLHVLAVLAGLLVPAGLALVAVTLVGRRVRTLRSDRVQRGLLRGSWPTALALRSASRAPREFVATAGAVALGVGALVFAASDTSFVSTPARYGWRWDSIVQVNSAPGNDDAASRHSAEERLFANLGEADAIVAASTGRSGQVALGRNGVVTSIIGLNSLKGDAVPLVVRGRMPVRRGEVALGEVVLRRESLRIGDTIGAGGGTRARSLRIVGSVVVPGLGLYPGNDAPPVGGSAVTTLDEFNDLVPPGADTFVLVRFDPSLPLSQRLAVVANALEIKVEDVQLIGLQRNVDAAAMAAVRRTPLVLAGVLAVLALATLTQALFAQSRRQRPMLAVLSALGAQRRGLRRFVVLHAVIVVCTALGVGTVVGVLLGRRVWGGVAHSLGVPPGHVIPVAGLLLAAAVALTLGVAAAWLPSRHAAQVVPGTTLRVE
jgi:hypothetical protein